MYHTQIENQVDSVQPSSARKKIGMVFHVEHFVVTEVYLHRFCRQPVKRNKSALVKTS